MQENEFEKRLQDEMSEFRVRPSEVVWNRIEDELRKKKRRRVIFYLFLLAGLSAVGYSGYVLFTPQKQILAQQDTTGANNIRDEKQEPSPADDAGKKANAVNEIGGQKKQSINRENTLKPENKIQNNNDAQLAHRRQREDGSGVLKPSAKINSVASKNNTAKTGNKTIATQGVKDVKDINRGMKPALIQSPGAQEKNIEANAQESSAEKQTNVAATGSEATTDKKQEQNMPAAPPHSSKKTKSSVRWALEVSGGISQLSNKAFSFTGVNQQADALYVSTPGNGPGGNVSVYYPPSEVNHGAAFRIAVVGEINISKRSSVSAGLGYAYYSNEIKTGSHKDSSFILRTMAAQSVSLNSYYQGSHVIEYRNKYHFVQVPVNYQFQLNKGVKIPIIWNIGVSPAYLFSTNALVYDTASGGIYYKNKDAFNKFHFNLNTGLSFRIGKPNKLQWSLGPEVSMDMTGLHKDSEPAANASSASGSQKRYFMYGGITGRVYFKKKNTK